MSQKTHMTLARMSSGQSGTIIDMQGGYGLSNRLAALGIMRGKRVTKVSSMILRGPVTVTVGRTHLALGYGMASKVVVELDAE